MFLGDAEERVKKIDGKESSKKKSILNYSKEKAKGNCEYLYIYFISVDRK